MGLGGTAQKVTEYNAMQVSAFYACVDLIAETIGMLPMDVYTHQGDVKKKVKRGRLVELLARTPDGVITPFEYRRNMVLNLLMYGNAYALIERAQSGNVKRIKVLHPQTVEMNVPLDQTPIYTVQGLDKPYSVSHENMIHVRNLYDNVYRGVSPLFFAQTVLGISLAQNEHELAYFQNGATPRGVLQLQGTLRDPKRKSELRDEIDRNFGGANAGKTMVLAEGSEYIPIATNNQESQLIEARKFQTEDIARLFRVPPQMIGHVDAIGRVGSSVEEMQLQFLQNCIQPICENIEQAHELRLAPMGVDIEFNYSEMRKTDLRTLSEHLERQKIAGNMTTNECRTALNLQPIAGGDKTIQDEPRNRDSERVPSDRE